MKKITLFVMLIVGLATACSKDKIESKTDDISRKWKVSEAKTNDGDDLKDLFDGVVLEYKKDGTYSKSGGMATAETGKWEFNEDGSKLIEDKGTNDEDVADIVELSSSKLKLKTSEGTITFIPA